MSITTLDQKMDQLTLEEIVEVFQEEEDFSKKKKKKKKTIEGEEFTTKKRKKKSKGKSEGEGEDSEVFTYESLLGRIFEEYMASKQKVSKLKIDELNIARDGLKKTVFVNLLRICKQVNRDIDQVALYIKTELGATCSLDSEKRLVIRGRYYPKQIKSVLLKYISEYVTCGTCPSNNTCIHKDPATRLNFKKCNSCGATSAVSVIKSGYSAVMRGDRKKN